MNNPLPEQLLNPSFRFFLAKKDGKVPINRRWNTDNCHMFFEPKLLNHILNRGNIGICTGYGSLIVIDFDDADYQKRKEPMLPKTFTVRTAIKGLHHKYYYLKGEMISKIGIGLERRLADVQAGKDGIICPPSHINGKFYSVVEDKPIAEIDCETLSRVFNIKHFKQSRRRKFNVEVQPEKIQEAIDLFKQLGIKRTDSRHFRCPFHKSNGEKNLFVFDNGSIYCFSCLKHFNSAEDFKAKWEELNGGIVII